jgi:hypothetical protein
VLNVFFALFITMNSAWAQLSLRNTMPTEAAIQNRFHAASQYSVSSDLLDDIEPRRYTHQLTLNTLYDMSSRWRLGVLASVDYFSFENEIVETQKGYGGAQFNSTFFTTYILNTPFFTSHNVGFSYTLPLDDESRFEGYRGVPAASTTLIKRVWPKYINLIQTFRGSYLINTYDKSALGQPNRDYAVGSSSILAFTISKNWSLLTGFGIRWSHLTDNNTDYAYNNFQTLNYNYRKLSFFLTHSNGGFTEDGKVSLWFVDRNRKFVDLGVSYDF